MFFFLISFLFLWLLRECPLYKCQIKSKSTFYNLSYLFIVNSRHHSRQQEHVTVAIATDHNNHNNITIHQREDRHHHFHQTGVLDRPPYLHPHLLLRGTVRAVMRLGVQSCFVIDSSCHVQKLRFQVCLCFTLFHEILWFFFKKIASRGILISHLRPKCEFHGILTSWFRKIERKKIKFFRNLWEFIFKDKKKDVVSVKFSTFFFFKKLNQLISGFFYFFYLRNRKNKIFHAF